MNKSKFSFPLSNPEPIQKTDLEIAKSILLNTSPEMIGPIWSPKSELTPQTENQNLNKVVLPYLGK
jgi:hypothetical protein